MALALIKPREIKRIIKLYEDVICLFHTTSSTTNLNLIITKRIEEIIANAYQLTDSLIKLVKVDLTDLSPKEELAILKLAEVDENDCPTVCYFKNGQIVGKHTKTFTNHLLQAWIKQFFYSEV